MDKVYVSYRVDERLMIRGGYNREKKKKKKVVSFSGERHNCKMGEGEFHRQQDVEKLYGGLQHCLC